MSKGIVEETVYVFLFRCEKCNRPIISWMLSPRHGGFSLEKAQTKALPLTCVMKECGWSEARFGRDAIESWAVPWTYTATGPRSEEHTSDLQSRGHLVCRLLLEKEKRKQQQAQTQT